MVSIIFARYRHPTTSPYIRDRHGRDRKYDKSLQQQTRSVLESSVKTRNTPRVQLSQLVLILVRRGGLEEFVVVVDKGGHLLVAAGI